MTEMFHHITRDDLLALQNFSKRIDELMQQYCSVIERDTPYYAKADEWGHNDLTHYLPWMGPRYRFDGFAVPLSIFRAEGMALFLLARILQPQLAIECYTGTGYAIAWLAAGRPEAEVYSVDNYSEGSVGNDGHSCARKLIQNLSLTNVTLLYGTEEDLRACLRGREPDLYFSDGPRVDPGPLAPHAVVVRHDSLDGQAAGRSFLICGGSHLSVMCPTAEQRDDLMSIMAKAFPVERCDERT